jgi:spermidine synthase
VRLVAEDARAVLGAQTEALDCVVGDLFLPWKRGVGLLYTVEHFRAVRERLAPGGVFAQWLPLYQLDRDEFRSVARSFLEAFPDATLWRGDFFARRPIVALVGTRDAPPLDPEAIARGALALEERGAWSHGEAAASVPFLLYAGRLAGGADDLAQAPRCTDDLPWIEFSAPRSERGRKARKEAAFSGRALLDFERALFAATPPDRDPWLARLRPAERRLVEAGLELYAFAVAGRDGDLAAKSEAFRRFVRLVPAERRPSFDDWIR